MRMFFLPPPGPPAPSFALMCMSARGPADQTRDRMVTLIVADYLGWLTR